MTLTLSSSISPISKSDCNLNVTFIDTQKKQIDPVNYQVETTCENSRKILIRVKYTNIILTQIIKIHFLESKNLINKWVFLSPYKIYELSPEE